MSKKERCTAVVTRQVTFAIAFQSRGRSPTFRKTANTSPKKTTILSKIFKTKPIISPSALSEALRLADAEKDREAKTPSSKKKESSSSSCETPSAEASDEDGEHDDEEGKAEMTGPDVFKVILLLSFSENCYQTGRWLVK